MGSLLFCVYFSVCVFVSSCIWTAACLAHAPCGITASLSSVHDGLLSFLLLTYDFPTPLVWSTADILGFPFVDTLFLYFCFYLLRLFVFVFVLFFARQYLFGDWTGLDWGTVGYGWGLMG